MVWWKKVDSECFCVFLRRVNQCDYKKLARYQAAVIFFVYLVGKDNDGSRSLSSASSSPGLSTKIRWYPTAWRFVAPMDNRGCLFLPSLSRFPKEFCCKGWRVRSVWLIVNRRLRAFSLVDGVADRIACWYIHSENREKCRAVKLIRHLTQTHFGGRGRKQQQFSANALQQPRFEYYLDSNKLST